MAEAEKIETEEEEKAETPEVPEPPKEETVSEEEIAQVVEELKQLEGYKKETADLKKQLSSTLDTSKLGKSLAEAIQPIIPKPPGPPKLWETDKILGSREDLISGIIALYQDRQDQYHKEKIEPLLNELNQLKSIIPELYARSMENPNFASIETRARELMSKYNVSRWQALEMARDQITEQQKTQQTVQTQSKPTIPKHMSTPDTKATASVEVEDKGSTDFRSIIRELKSSGKF